MKANRELLNFWQHSRIDILQSVKLSTTDGQYSGALVIKKFPTEQHEVDLRRFTFVHVHVIQMPLEVTDVNLKFHDRDFLLKK